MIDMGKVCLTGLAIPSFFAMTKTFSDCFLTTTNRTFFYHKAAKNLFFAAKIIIYNHLSHF